MCYELCPSSQHYSLPPEDGGSKVLQNIDILLQHYLPSQPRRQLEISNESITNYILN